MSGLCQSPNLEFTFCRRQKVSEGAEVRTIVSFEFRENDLQPPTATQFDNVSES